MRFEQRHWKHSEAMPTDEAVGLFVNLTALAKTVRSCRSEQGTGSVANFVAAQLNSKLQTLTQTNSRGQ